MNSYPDRYYIICDRLSVNGIIILQLIFMPNWRWKWRYECHGRGWWYILVEHLKIQCMETKALLLYVNIIYLACLQITSVCNACYYFILATFKFLLCQQITSGLIKWNLLILFFPSLGRLMLANEEVVIFIYYESFHCIYIGNNWSIFQFATCQVHGRSNGEV